jgi:rSAM/selenodomain-associated transferase 2
MPVRTPFLSIVLPVLNEAPLVPSFLLHLRAVAPGVEIIVVDGGSHDGTASIAEPLADVVISARRGRALQMNAGAAVARGDVLWFLHADLEVPRHSVREIEQALSDRRTVGGCFRLHFPERQCIYRISDSIGNVAIEVFGFALGDHGIFCRREVFNQIGGYRDVPILEDAEIYRALRSRGGMVQLRDEILCSPRAYLKYGPYRTTAVYFLILALYVAGVPISSLNRIYRWFRGSAAGVAPRSSQQMTIFERRQMQKRIAG